MSENIQLKRDITWLTTWVAEHHDSRAAVRIARVLDAYAELEAVQEPVEKGVPDAENATKYILLRNTVTSLVPDGSVFKSSIADEGVLATNFVHHLYRNHTLGCVECFGGSHRV
jgi:hypothetical protein